MKRLLLLNCIFLILSFPSIAQNITVTGKITSGSDALPFDYAV